MGIDSAFALFEATLTCLQDTTYFQNVDRKIIAIFPILIGFGFSLIYCTDAGLYFLDVIDFYVNFVMILVGFAQTFGAGWAYNIRYGTTYYSFGCFLGHDLYIYCPGSHP